MAETKWLTTAEGKIHFPVVKGFTFLMPVVRNDGIQLITSRERRFEKGDHVLDPANPEDAQVLSHPWIARDLADGAVESPEVTRARLEQEAEQARIRKERTDALLAEAAVVLERSVRSAQGTADVGADVEDDLNTPLNQMRVGRKSRGSGRKEIDFNDPAVQAQLNTPLNQLPKAGNPGSSAH
jgi:hypothetical protein